MISSSQALVIFVLLLSTSVFGSSRTVPKNSRNFSPPDWFPYVISKIAPLERWSYEGSMTDVRKENYLTDSEYQASLRNTWTFPRFCFSLFRPSPESDFALYSAVNDYQGPVVWVLVDGCITAFPTRPTFYAPIAAENDRAAIESAIANPPKASPDFVQKAIDDIPHFCRYLEERLGLGSMPSQDFDEGLLTRDGLATSRPEFEDFVDRGSWAVMLTSSPEATGNLGSSASVSRSLNFGIKSSEFEAIVQELGGKWGVADESSGPLLPEYPLLSRSHDFLSNVFYRPEEVNRLLAECMRGQSLVKSPGAVRGLDKFLRIARWAERDHTGILFIGQD